MVLRLSNPSNGMAYTCYGVWFAVVMEHLVRKAELGVGLDWG